MGLFINGGSLGPDVNSALFGDNFTLGKDILNSSAFQDFASKFQTDFMNFLNGTSKDFDGNSKLGKLAPDLTGDTYLSVSTVVPR